MLTPDAFQLPLESSLKLRIIEDEIENCRNIDEMRERMKELVKLNLHYQQMLNVVLKKVIDKELKDFMPTKK